MDRLAVLKQKELELAFKQRQLDLDLEQFKILQEIATLETAAKTSRSATPRDENIHSNLEQEPNPISSTATATTASKQGAVIDLTVGEDIKIESDDDDPTLRLVKRKRVSPESEANDSQSEKEGTMRLTEYQSPLSPARRARAASEPNSTPTTVPGVVVDGASPRQSIERTIQPSTTAEVTKIVSLKLPRGSQTTDKTLAPVQDLRAERLPTTGLSTPPVKCKAHDLQSSHARQSGEDEIARRLLPPRSPRSRSLPSQRRSRIYQSMRRRRTNTLRNELRGLEDEHGSTLSHATSRLFKRSRPPAGSYLSHPRLTDQELLTSFCRQTFDFILENARIPSNQTMILVPNYFVKNVLKPLEYKSIGELLDRVRMLLVMSSHGKEPGRSFQDAEVDNQIEDLEDLWNDFKRHSEDAGPAPQFVDMFVDV